MCVCACVCASVQMSLLLRVLHTPLPVSLSPFLGELIHLPLTCCSPSWSWLLAPTWTSGNPDWALCFQRSICQFGGQQAASSWFPGRNMLQTPRGPESPCLDPVGNTPEGMVGQRSANPASSASCVTLVKLLNLSEPVSSLVWEVVVRTK